MATAGTIVLGTLVIVIAVVIISVSASLWVAGILGGVIGYVLFTIIGGFISLALADKAVTTAGGCKPCDDLRAWWCNLGPGKRIAFWLFAQAQFLFKCDGCGPTIGLPGPCASAKNPFL